MNRIKNACRVLLGLDQAPIVNNVIEPQPFLETLDMQPGDKLILCISETISLDEAVRIRDQFDAALKGDKNVLVMGKGFHRFVLVKGMKTT